MSYNDETNGGPIGNSLDAKSQWSSWWLAFSLSSAFFSTPQHYLLQILETDEILNQLTEKFDETLRIYSAHSIDQKVQSGDTTGRHLETLKNIIAMGMPGLFRVPDFMQFLVTEIRSKVGFRSEQQLA